MSPDHASRPEQGPAVSRHALKALEDLWAEVLRLAATVLGALTTSVQALREGRADLADEVKIEEKAIDGWEVRIEQECVRVLALFGPTASDLRRVVAALRITAELELMADLAENIADRARKRAANLVAPPFPPGLVALAAAALDQVRDSIDALTRDDVALAQKVIANDRAVGQARRAVQRELKQALQQDPDRVSVWLRLINTARNLERVADHAAHIAEAVVYLKEGDIIRHGGPPPPDANQ
ncbi:MAG: phosphate signaling complex protein PhoU [Planctomycetaceae bacterium]